MSVDLLLPRDLLALALLSGLLVDLLQLVLLRGETEQKRNRSEEAPGAPPRGKDYNHKGQYKRKKRRVRAARPTRTPVP